MCAVEINGAEVFTGYEILKAWEAFRSLVETMIAGDEVTLWVDDRLQRIETRFFPAEPVEA